MASLLLIFGILSAFFVCSEGFFGIRVNVQLTKDIMKPTGEITTALGKASKGITDLQKILLDTQSQSVIDLKYNLVVIQNTLKLTAAFMTKLGKYAGDTNGVSEVIFQEIKDDLKVINGIYASKIINAVIPVDSVFSSSIRSQIFDQFATKLVDIATQITIIENNVTPLFKKKVTEGELNAVLDTTTIEMFKENLSSGVALMAPAQIIFEEILKKANFLVTYVKTPTAIVATRQSSINESLTKAIRYCDNASKGFLNIASDLKTFNSMLEQIYATLLKYEDNIITAVVPTIIEKLNIGLYENLVLNYNANIAVGTSISNLQSAIITSITKTTRDDLNAAMTANIVYASKIIRGDTKNVENCFTTHSVNFNNILRLYGSDLQSCIDGEADSISNIFARFLLQNRYFRDTVNMVTESIKQCVNSNIMSSSPASAREVAFICLKDSSLDYSAAFQEISQKMQSTTMNDQLASMNRMMTCQTNAKDVYDTDLAFYAAVYNACAASSKRNLKYSKEIAV